MDNTNLVPPKPEYESQSQSQQTNTTSPESSKNFIFISLAGICGVILGFLIGHILSQAKIAKLTEEVNLLKPTTTQNQQKNVFQKEIYVTKPEPKIIEDRKIQPDEKRLQDIRQLSSAFEIYFNDFGKYPPSLNSLVPIYLGSVPVTPPAEGSCTQYVNKYDYYVDDTGRNYTLTFCIGMPTGGYQPGMRALTPSGIK